jgi:hypothetical protein
MIDIELDSEQEDKIVVKSLTQYYKSECNELTGGRDEALLTSIETVLDSYMSLVSIKHGRRKSFVIIVMRQTQCGRLCALRKSAVWLCLK